MIRAWQGLAVAAMMAGAVSAQGVREHTRARGSARTEVSETQATELTLTVVETARRPIQTWVRSAGVPDGSGRVLAALVAPPEADLVRVGQRVRVFSPDSKSSMTQARVTRVTSRRDGAGIEVTLPVRATAGAGTSVLEIVVDRGSFLAVANEAIIEEGDRQVVYVQEHPGHYVPREIQTGVKGELYAEVLGGLEEGDRVVTFGSFFIDAEHKLRSAGPGAAGHAHQNH